MIQLGLIGWPVSHSFSPKLHNAALKAAGLEGDYKLFPIAPQVEGRFLEIFNLIRVGEIIGINITIPYKKTVINYMDELTPMAKLVGAVNTIYFKNGKLIGDNTDATGFLVDLHNKMPKPSDFSKNALVIGSGGSARAVVAALIEDNWHVILAARNLDRAKELSESISNAVGVDLIKFEALNAESLSVVVRNSNLIVNTTPLGMFPNIEASPWPHGLNWVQDVFIYDLVYNPRETMLMNQAKTHGLAAVNGLGMLVEQAALAFEIWTGVAAPREVMYSVVSSEFS
jgi:shikimate dehydrogenase